jgi:hypothetical protein
MKMLVMQKNDIVVSYDAVGLDGWVFGTRVVIIIAGVV